MPAFLLLLKTNKTARTIAIVIVSALALGVIYAAWAHHQRAIGSSQGEEKQKQVEIQSVGKEVIAAKDTESAELRASEDRVRAAEQSAQLAHSQAQAALQLASLAQAQQKQLSDRLASMSDGDLHGYTIGELKLRQPGESNACYTAKEERAIASAITQWPKCEEGKRDDEAALTKQEKQISDVQDQLKELKGQIATQARYTGKLEDALTTLYNFHPPKVRAMRCMKMWKCGTGKLVIPNPKTLKE